MTLENLILFSYIPLGFVCLSRPVLFLYLFLTIPIYEYIPAAIADFSSLKIFQFGSINIFLTDYLMLMLAVYFLINIVKKNPRFHAALKTPVSLAVIFLFLWQIFISLLSYSKGFELQNILRNLSVESLLFITILVPLIGHFYRKQKHLLYFTVLLSVLVVGFAVLKYGIFHEVEITSSATQRTLAGNAVIIFLFPLCYVLYYSRFRHTHGWLTLLYVTLIAVGIHFAGHRSGWIVFIFVIGIWFAFQQQKLQLVWVPLWSVALAVTLVMFAISVDLKSGTPVSDFFIRIADTVNIENTTTQERLSKWKYSFDTLAKKPLLGLGRFPVYTKHLDEDNLFLAQSFSELNRDPHNLIATKAVHEGLLGLSVLAIFFFVIFKQLGKASFEDKPFYDFLKVFIIALLIYSLFNPVVTNETGRIFLFTALGLLNARILNHAFAKDPEEYGTPAPHFVSAG